MKRIVVLGIIAIALTGCGKKETENNSEQANQSAKSYLEDQKNEAKKSVNINPNMDIVQLAVCTAASMKIGQGVGVYKVWTEELINRYHKAHPEMSENDLESYSSQRIDDKLRFLKDKGINSEQSFIDYYESNCK